ncbi:hypothetical protein EJB05_48002, partial [Eragrostis curvula]
MGAAVSGHSSCPDHRGRLTCVDSNDVAGARCRVCQLPVAVGARVHRCRNPGCGFVLHDGCFRLPSKVKRHFAHPGHRLTLAAVAGGHDYCSLCTGKLDAHAHAYSCAATPACSAGGFRAHPRCCHLPEKMLDEKLHKHGRLVLRPPPPSRGGNGRNDGGGGRARRKKCLRCRKTTTAKAWSYQCTDAACNDDREICLTCVLGNGGDDDDAAQCCCGDVDPGRLGEWIGALLCGIGQGMGIPCCYGSRK